MKRITSQWRSFKSGMPFWRAISSARSSVHCSGFWKKPSASTSIVAPRSVCADISGLLLGQCGGWFVVCGGEPLAGEGQARRDAREVATREQQVPVDPPERELAEVVEPGLPQQRQRPEDEGEPAGHRLDRVVEVDQQRLGEAGFDETVRVPVEAGIEGPACEEALD